MMRSHGYSDQFVPRGLTKHARVFIADISINIDFSHKYRRGAEFSVYDDVSEKTPRFACDSVTKV